MATFIFPTRLAFELSCTRITSKVRSCLSVLHGPVNSLDSYLKVLHVCSRLPQYPGDPAGLVVILEMKGPTHEHHFNVRVKDVANNNGASSLSSFL